MIAVKGRNTSTRTAKRMNISAPSMKTMAPEIRARMSDTAALTYTKTLYAAVAKTRSAK